MNKATSWRRHLRFCAVGFAALLLLAPVAPASAHGGGGSTGGGHGSSATVLLDGLNSPKGLDSFFGQPIIAQGAFGPPGPVLAHSRSPWHKPKTIELSNPISLIDVAVAYDGSLWGLAADAQDGSPRMLYRKGTFDRTFVPVANITAYQQGDPDPTDTEGNPTESNPYGLAVMRNGDALVADAANNDLLRITRRGQISTVARFDTEDVSTDQVGDPNLPPTIPAEAVPTSIAVVGHWAYVGELKGFPFRPGSSRVLKVDLRSSGSECSVNPSIATRGCRTAMAGFTAIQDLDINPWTGDWYVYQLAAGGVLAFEAGFDSGNFPPAVLEKVSRRGRRSELVPGQLSQPGGVDVGVFGTVHVTDGTFGNGRLLRING